MNESFVADPSMKLGEAIQKMRELELEPTGNLATQISVDVAQALEQHDAVHILFNCGTSIQDEIAVHVWMVFATTMNLNEMHRAVASQEHRTVLSGIGHLNLVGIWVASLPRLLSILFKSLQMKKKFAVEELPQLKKQSIQAIRREHGIVL